jgi:hypothetical protein
MTRRVGVWVLLGMAFLWRSAAVVPAAELDRSLRTIRAVESEGRGNKEATLAWRELARSPGKDAIQS